MISQFELSSVGILMLLAQCALCSAGDRFESLPSRMGNSLSPELYVRVAVENGVQRLALIATLNVDSPVPIFNPFGHPKVGRPYQLVLMDSERQQKWIVVPTTPIAIQSNDPQHWVRSRRGGVMGRCYWQRTSHDAMEKLDEDEVVFPSVPAGRYFFVLLVNRRMIHAPPNPKLKTNVHLWTDSWNNSLLDQPGCISAPVAVDIDTEGKYHIDPVAGQNSRFSVLESEATAGPDHALSVSTRLVNPIECRMLLPGMNLYATTTRPIRTTVTRVDGQQFERFTSNYAGSGIDAHSNMTDSVLVPRNGIVGGHPDYAGHLIMPGDYRVTTQVNESVYPDKLFVDGERVIRESRDWLVEFRSPDLIITVPSKMKE